MRNSCSWIMLLVLVAQMHANEIRDNPNADGQARMDMLVDKLADRVLTVLPRTGLDDTVVAKEPPTTTPEPEKYIPPQAPDLGPSPSWTIPELLAPVHISVYVIIAIQTVLLAFLQFGEKILPSNFLARKTCHAGSGLLMLLLDSYDIRARIFVCLVVFTSLGVTWRMFPSWVPKFRFGDEYDAGITIYLLIVATWFCFEQPPMALAPLFFADPMGAVVGKACSKRGINKVWYENKTVMGTLAVFAFALISLSIPEVEMLSRVGVALACALAEAFGGKTYDNAVIAVPALGSYVYYHGIRKFYGI